MNWSILTYFGLKGIVRVMFSALKNVGSANRHPSNVTAHVAAYHFFVGMEAAGADDYTAFSHEVNGFIILIDGSAA